MPRSRSRWRGGVGARERPVRAAGEAVQPGGVLLDLLPRRPRLALRAAGGGGGEQAAEVRVAGAVLDQQPERARVLDRDLGADERPHAGAPRGREEARRAVDAVAVGERERVVAERGGALDQVLRQRGAAQEAEGAAAAQLDVVGVPRHVRLCFAVPGRDRVKVFADPAIPARRSRRAQQAQRRAGSCRRGIFAIRASVHPRSSSPCTSRG